MPPSSGSCPQSVIASFESNAAEVEDASGTRLGGTVQINVDQAQTVYAIDYYNQSVPYAIIIIIDVVNVDDGSVGGTNPPEPCAAGVCQNGGFCTATNGLPLCECPLGFTGDFCETGSDPCTPNPCRNGGTCTASGTTTSCACAAGFMGGDCGTVDPCTPNPCENGGTCTVTTDSAACTCPARYTGTLCQSDLAPSGLTYSMPVAAYAKGVAIIGNAPSLASGAADSYSIDPALPAGLSFNAITGVISGTPTAYSAAKAYTITALSSAFGSATVTVTISIMDAFRDCGDLLARAPGTPSGVYAIDPDGSATGVSSLPAYCDMSTPGDGLTLVLNYVHKGGTNPDNVVMTNALPILGSMTLGTDESGTSNWGHAGTALLSKLNVCDLIFYGTSSAHSRTVHFKTSHTGCVSYFRTGTGSCSGLQSSFTPLSGHTAYLPGSTAGFSSNMGDNAMVDAPFFVASYSWASLKDMRHVDDYPNSAANDTLQQIWVSTSATKSLDNVGVPGGQISSSGTVSYSMAHNKARATFQSHSTFSSCCNGYVRAGLPAGYKPITDTTASNWDNSAQYAPGFKCVLANGNSLWVKPPDGLSVNGAFWIIEKQSVVAEAGDYCEWTVDPSQTCR